MSNIKNKINHEISILKSVIEATNKFYEDNVEMHGKLDYTAQRYLGQIEGLWQGVESLEFLLNEL